MFRGWVVLASVTLGRLFDPSLEPADLRRQLAIRRGAQKRVDAALALDCADCGGRHPRAGPAQPVGPDRSELQIRQKAALRLDVGVADIVPDLDTLAGHRTFARHAAPRQKPVNQTQRAVTPGPRACIFYRRRLYQVKSS